LVILKGFRDFYDAFEDYFSGLMLFIGLSMIFINVVLRYFWGRPQSLLDEFSVYFIVWGILAGVAVALRNNHHIKVDMLYNTLNIKVKRYVSMFSNTVGLAFAFFYTYYGFQLVANYIESGQRSADSQFQLWIVYMIMPISGLLFGIRFIDKLVLLFRNGGKEWLDIEAKGGHQ